jgi:hypothetical protein
MYKYFISLDLFSGFYQVPVAKGPVDKTAFITPDSNNEFLRVPFGLCNSPSVFQPLMNNVLGPLRNTFPYIDDVIIPSTTVEKDLERLRLVLESFRKHNLRIKLSKFSFFSTNIDYLGREISAEGVRPERAKIEAVSQMSAPKTVKHVRQFLGLSGYFRKFIEHYDKVAEPLARLTRQDITWCWDSERQTAFNKAKTLLISRV